MTWCLLRLTVLKTDKWEITFILNIYYSSFGKRRNRSVKRWKIGVWGYDHPQKRAGFENVEKIFSAKLGFFALIFLMKCIWKGVQNKDI